MRYILFILLALTLYIYPYQPLFAEDNVEGLEACAAPLKTEIPAESNVSFCDVYSRQIAYRDNRLAYRAQIEERRKDFIRPSLQAKRKYDKDLQAMYKKELEKAAAGSQSP